MEGGRRKAEKVRRDGAPSPGEVSVVRLGPSGPLQVSGRGRVGCLTSASRVGTLESRRRASALPELGEMMTALIPAIYEGGILRPLEPVDLAERERVYMLLLPDEPAKVAAGQRAALADLIGIGESRETEISARHDEFLYPRPQ